MIKTNNLGTTKISGRTAEVSTDLMYIVYDLLREGFLTEKEVRDTVEIAIVTVYDLKTGKSRKEI